MTSPHGKSRKSSRSKARARQRQKRTGASYTSAAAGTTHDHRGPELVLLPGINFGVGRVAELSMASRLVAAAHAGCLPCQDSLIDQVLDGDRLVIAQMAAWVYGAVPVAGFLATPTTQRFAELAREAIDAEDGRPLLALVEGLQDTDLEDLLNDTLDLWAVAAPALMGTGGAAAPDDSDAPTGAEQDKPLRVVADVGAYMVAPGVDQFLDEPAIGSLLQLAEASTTGGDPIVCHLCDECVDVAQVNPVHLGLATFTTSRGDALTPVWTHPGCGPARIWTLEGLDEERARRGLSTGMAAAMAGPTSATDESAQPPASGPRERAPDYTLGSVVQLPRRGIVPLLVIQPGEPHEHGLDGHMADLLSMGLKPVALDGRPIAEVPTWQVRVDRGRLTALTRSGAGTWYRQDGGHPMSEEWRKAARKQRAALVIVLPAGTITDDGTDQRSALARAAEQGRALGGLMSIRGTLS